MCRENTMRRRQRLCLLAFALLLTLFTAVNASAAVKLNKREASIYVGRTLTLKPTSGTAKSWKSSDKKIATVSSKGVVKGKKAGTIVISCKVGGKTLTCTLTVRNKKLSRYVTNAQAEVWKNMIGAVESGGMVYGNRDYTCFVGPYNSSDGEDSSTAGAYQEYGENLRQLLIAIRTQYPVTFKKYDTAGIAEDLSYNWYNTNYQVYPGSAKARSIQKIIGSSAGKKVQDIRIVELLDEYLDHIVGELGVTNLRAALFMAECEHLGGSAPVDRVVLRAAKRNKISSLKKSLYLDQQDYSSSNQIGDSFYKGRHEALYKWIVKYIPASAKVTY